MTQRTQFIGKLIAESKSESNYVNQSQTFKSKTISDKIPIRVKIEYPTRKEVNSYAYATIKSTLKKAGRQLGPDYETTIIDLEYVIRRDFGNGYDLEISGVNTSSLKRKATLYVWKDKKHIVEKVYRVSRDDIGIVADKLYQKYSSL